VAKTRKVRTKPAATRPMRARAMPRTRHRKNLPSSGDCSSSPLDRALGPPCTPRLRSPTSMFLTCSFPPWHVDSAIEGKAAVALAATGLLAGPDPDPGPPIPPACALIALPDDDSRSRDLFFVDIVRLFLIETFP